MSIYGYTPPVGFGDGTVTDPTKKKQNPDDADYPGIGAAPSTTGATGDLPGLAPVASYTPTQYDAGNAVDLSQPVQIAPGSRSGDIMADSGYQGLLASLGLDDETARARTAFGVTAAGNKLTANLADLAQQSQEDKYGIDATLRARGAGRGSQREALQARADANAGKQETNLRGMSADEVSGLYNQLADTEGQLKRAEATGATEAAGRLQTAKDALLARLQQQQSSDNVLAAQQQQSAQIQAALAQLAAQNNQADQAPAASQPAGELSFAEKLARMSPAERAAWDVFAAGGQPAAPAPPPAVAVGPSRGPAPARTPAPAPAPAYSYRQNFPAVKATEPLRPMQGKY